MWTDDTEDEILPVSVEHLEESCEAGSTQHFLFGKTTIVILTFIAVILSGILPYLAVRSLLMERQNNDLKPKIDFIDDVQSGTIPDSLAENSSINARRPAVNHVFMPHKAHPRRSRSSTVSTNAPEKLMHQQMERSSSCSSARCKHEAKNISSLLDDSVDPCGDFYNYVCRKWASAVHPPSGTPSVSVDTLTQDLLTRLVDVGFRRYVEDLELVADLYNECRYHKTGDVEKPLFDHIVHRMGNTSWFLNIRNMVTGLKKSLWPSFTDISDPMISRNIGTFYRTVNEPALFSIKPATDMDFPNETLIGIGFPKLVLGSFLSEFDSSNYSFMLEAMNMIFTENNLTEGVNVDVLNIERLLASAIRSSPPEAPRMMQIGNLPSVGKLRWNTFFKALMAEEDMTFNPIYVAVDSVHYLEALQGVLRNLENFEILAYLGFRAKLVLAPLLPKNRNLDFLGALAVSRFPEWHPPLTGEHYCVRFFDRFEPIMSLYAARDVITTVLHHINTTPLVQAVRKAFFDELSILFSADFRNYLLEQISEAKWTSLMPNWVHKERSRKKYLDFFYSKIQGQSAFRQFAHLIQSKNSNAVARYLRGEYMDVAWDAGLLRTTASACRERIDVPPASFDFFRASADEPALRPYQMARLGPRILTSVFSLVFQEAFSYLFHDGGHTTWRHLNLTRSCIVDQFKNDVHQSRTNASTISDASGWSLLADALSVDPSFKAFLSILSRETPLEGLEGFSSEKMFFLYYALNYCESSESAFMSKLLKYTNEAPAWYRVNGALRNSKIFTKVFDCQEGTFMHPAKRCTVVP